MKKLLTAFVTAALLTVCLCVPAFAADVEFDLCSHIETVNTEAQTAGLELRYDSSDHYIYCPYCSCAFPFSALGDGAIPHVETDCSACLALLSYGLIDGGSLIPSDPPGVLPSITTLVTVSIDWLTAFALCIISTPLFLIFVCCIFVGLGIALIKRSIHL